MNHPFRNLFSFLRGRKGSSPADKLVKDSHVTVETPQSHQEAASSTDKPVAEHKFYTKDELVAALKEIKERGWVENTEPQNDGAVGNILEHLLGIPTNNIPMPDATEWELKAQKSNTNSLISLSPPSQT